MNYGINILSLDTSSSNCSIALQYNGEVEEIYGDKIDRSKKLLIMIQQLLNIHKISLYDLDILAFSGGPGSLTGLKIGSCVIQAINLVYQKPITKVSTLEALAVVANEEFGNNKIIPYINARMGQIYYGFYEFFNQDQSKDRILFKVPRKMHQDTIGTIQDLAVLTQLNPDALLVSDDADVISINKINKINFSAKSILKVADYHYKKYGIISNDSDPIYLCSYK